MAEVAFTLTAAPILGGVDHQIGDNQIVERDDLALVSIAVPLGRDDAVQAALRDGWGLDWPEPTMSSVNGETRAIRTSPDQLLLLFPHITPDANAVIQQKLNGAGYTTDQTDVWVVLEINGPDTLSALQRICPLDVETMPVSGSGRTVMEHMGAMLVRLGANQFLLLSASSSAQSFLHAVETSLTNVID